MAGTAAIASHLADTGEITARERSAATWPANRTATSTKGIDRRAWEQKQARAELDAMIGRAPRRPGHRQAGPGDVTVGRRTLAGLYRERPYLIGLGIPDGLLPDHRALDRTCLRL